MEHPLDQYVWDVRYAKAPVVRFHDGNTDNDYDGGSEEGDNTLYYTHDANWNTTAVVAEATGEVAERYYYDAYGQAHFCNPSTWAEIQWSGSLQNEVLYGGYGLDAESGLYHTDAREYHGSLGRFVQVDPIGTAGGLNVYAYCNDSPADTVDPSGLLDLDKFKQGIWDAGRGMIDFLVGMGAGDSFTSDPQQMANGEADFLCGLLTAAEGLKENPIFGKLRDLVRTAQGMANAGLMVVGVLRTANSLRGAAKARGPSVVTTAPAPATGPACMPYVPTKGSKTVAPYKRPSGATTPAQRAAVQGKPCVDCGTKAPKMHADHKKPLVEEHYETGTINTTRMRDIKSVQPQCPDCSNAQGGWLSGFARRMKKRLGL